MSYGRSMDYFLEEINFEAQTGEEDESESEMESEIQQLSQLRYDFPEFHRVECYRIFAEIPYEVKLQRMREVMGDARLVIEKLRMLACMQQTIKNKTCAWEIFLRCYLSSE